MGSKRISLKGKGADLFFGDYTPDTPPSSPPPEQPDDTHIAAEAVADAMLGEQLRIPHYGRDSEQEGKQASNRASKHASAKTTKMDPVEIIRRIVKRPGKEVVYVRLTPEEKSQLADVVYRYKRQGVRTSDNELGRIAINNLLADYREHGDESMLAKVLAALLA